MSLAACCLGQGSVGNGLTGLDVFRHSRAVEGHLIVTSQISLTWG